MRLHNGLGVRIVAIPGTVDIIRHEVEPVNIRFHSGDIEAFEVP